MDLDNFRIIQVDFVADGGFLADRRPTNGRAYATVLRLSSSSSSVTLCIVAKRCA